MPVVNGVSSSCILSKFYIKPQLSCISSNGCCVVSYRNSTSNHNLRRWLGIYSKVVSYRNSTSNHNTADLFDTLNKLYLIEILHQTTTLGPSMYLPLALYLIEILHQTTTLHPIGARGTPVVSYRNSTSNHNISQTLPTTSSVVSYRNSTSNHNLFNVPQELIELYLIEILHQTTTSGLILIDKVLLTGCLPL